MIRSLTSVVLVHGQVASLFYTGAFTILTLLLLSIGPIPTPTPVLNSRSSSGGSMASTLTRSSVWASRMREESPRPRSPRAAAVQQYNHSPKRSLADRGTEKQAVVV